jgi:serine/threonine protein phosphatase PrpC
MQGWRKRMEDSHITEINLNNNPQHVFGVFDGHGGNKVLIQARKSHNL